MPQSGPPEVQASGVQSGALSVTVSSASLLPQMNYLHPTQELGAGPCAFSTATEAVAIDVSDQSTGTNRFRILQEVSFNSLPQTSVNDGSER